jgi:hypothetical protein
MIEQYALNEASSVFVKFLRRFDGMEALNLGPIRKPLGLARSPANGVNVKLPRAAE